MSVVVVVTMYICHWQNVVSKEIKVSFPTEHCRSQFYNNSTKWKDRKYTKENPKIQNPIMKNNHWESSYNILTVLSSALLLIEAPKWRSGLRHCISVLEISLQTLV
jgi:hypothetical protein